MKEKEEEEKFFVGDCLCDSARYNCYDDLIREEREQQKKKATKAQKA